MFAYEQSIPAGKGKMPLKEAHEENRSREMRQRENGRDDERFRQRRADDYFFKSNLNIEEYDHGICAGLVFGCAGHRAGHHLPAF